MTIDVMGGGACLPTCRHDLVVTSLLAVTLLCCSAARQGAFDVKKTTNVPYYPMFKDRNQKPRGHLGRVKLHQSGEMYTNSIRKQRNSLAPQLVGCFPFVKR
jgi:hypothetical protein